MGGYGMQRPGTDWLVNNAPTQYNGGMNGGGYGMQRYGMNNGGYGRSRYGMNGGSGMNGGGYGMQRYGMNNGYGMNGGYGMNRYGMGGGATACSATVWAAAMV